jgi:Ca2+-binding EF-hand superfamily protein
MWLDPDHADLILYFGTIDRSVLSLFQAMSGGNDWSAFYDPLLALPLYYAYGFLLFIAFALFAVVNIVTGVFVESALQANIKDKDIVVHEELQSKKAYLQSMQELFEEMDEDGKGTISLVEFEGKLSDEKVIAYFNVLKLDVTDARTLFKLLDWDNSDEVGIDEFLDGCYKLQGESRSLDMKIMQYEVQFLQERMTKVQDTMNDIRDHQLHQPQQLWKSAPAPIPRPPTTGEPKIYPAPQAPQGEPQQVKNNRGHKQATPGEAEMWVQAQVRNPGNIEVRAQSKLGEELEDV